MVVRLSDERVHEIKTRTILVANEGLSSDLTMAQVYIRDLKVITGVRM
jgi:hypothetical protein